MNIYEFGDQPIAELEAASPASLHDMHNELRVTMALADVHEQTTACSVLYEAPGNHELKLEVSAGVTERDILKHGFKVTADNMYLAHGGHTPTATRETLVRHMGKLIDGFFDNCEVPPNEAVWVFDCWNLAKRGTGAPDWRRAVEDLIAVSPHELEKHTAHSLKTPFGLAAGYLEFETVEGNEAFLYNKRDVNPWCERTSVELRPSADPTAPRYLYDLRYDGVESLIEELPHEPGYFANDGGEQKIYTELTAAKVQRFTDMLHLANGCIIQKREHVQP